jgi:putative membrane protein
MAGLLYLYRLYVYHAMEKEQIVKDRFKVMEKKLFNYITVPAMVATVVFGSWMIGLAPSLLSEKWLLLKLALAGAMIGWTVYGGLIRVEFELDQCTKSHKFFRYMNEGPTLLMILIVFLVILRPFG